MGHKGSDMTERLSTAQRETVDFLGGSDGKESAFQAGDSGLIPEQTHTHYAPFPKLVELLCLTSTTCGMQSKYKFIFVSYHLSTIFFSQGMYFPSPWMKT